MSFDVTAVKIAKTTQLLVANNNMDKMIPFIGKEFKAIGYWLRKGAPKEGFDPEKDTIGLIYEVDNSVKVYVSYFALKSFYVKDGGEATKVMNLDDKDEMSAYNFTLREVIEKKYNFTVSYEDETPGVSSLPYFVEESDLTELQKQMVLTGKSVYSPFVYKNIGKIRKQYDEFEDVWKTAFNQGTTNLRDNYKKQVECDLVVEVIA